MKFETVTIDASERGAQLVDVPRNATARTARLDDEGNVEILYQFQAEENPFGDAEAIEPRQAVALIVVDPFGDPSEYDALHMIGGRNGVPDQKTGVAEEAFVTGSGLFVFRRH